LAANDGETRRRTPPKEEYATVSDVSVIGCVGTLIVATRGDRGAGEVLLTVRGAREAFLAWSDEPLPKGAQVLVVEARGARTVAVEPWHTPVDLGDRSG
jgi:membrane protein implicated in regulation of membrane protease activity